MPKINNLILVLSYPTNLLLRFLSKKKKKNLLLPIQKNKISITWRHKLWVSVSHIPCPKNDFPSIRKRKRIMAIPKFWVPHVLIYLKTQIRKPHYKRSCFAPPINPRLFPFFFIFPHCKNFAPNFLISQTQTQTLC